MTKELTNIKVFFIDLDGTLLDEKHHEISPTNLQAIHKLQKKANVILSTGRLGQNLSKYMKLTKVKYAVAGNGSQIVNSEGKVLWSKPIDQKTVKFVLDFAKKTGLSFKVDDGKTAYGVKGIISRLICRLLRYKILKHRNFDLRGIYKLVLWGKNKYKMQRFVKKLKKVLVNASLVTSTRGYTIEITHHQATKGFGNEFVWKQLLHINDIKKTAHIGDSMNDSTVIGFVGMMVAMKNSPRDLIKIADYVGPHYKKGGFAKLINGYKLKRVKK